ncbi:MAG: glyoxalase [Bacteroidia bacterium]|nr:glyoxalase [Bacteroidia bacterium]
MKVIQLIIFFLVMPGFTLPQWTNTNENPSTMQFEDVYNVYISKDIQACKTFYQRAFDCEVVFESTFFILLSTRGEKNFSVAFMSEDHPTSPPEGTALRAGEGVFLTLQVADVVAALKAIEQKGIHVSYGLHDEPWGQRRFGLTDPNGMYIDVVQQTEPAQGFWDPYMPR